MKVLLTGADGYIGAVAGPVLAQRGHAITGLDTGLYREGWLYPDVAAVRPACLNRDIRHIRPEDLEGFDAVVHLAELSNDPLAQLRPELTYRINHEGSVQLASLCREAGVRRFVYASSCSVYGVGTGEFKDEESAVDPQTPYADCKVLVERDVGALADDAFSPTFLRNATAYGPSPRMRFDIVLNNLAGHAWTRGEIRMTSDGSPWRPLAHVRDICQAIAATLEAPRETVHNEVFNVGSTEENYRIREVAEIVSETFPGCELTIGTSDQDNRSYRVSFDKIHECLPDFRCEMDAEAGARELRGVFEWIDMSLELFEFRPFTRLKQLLHLLATEQISEELFWTPPPPAPVLQAQPSGAEPTAG
jgi:nucleoside-diphosphate-sugar epimerase